MRVELLYAPGCTSFAKARKTLEMAIADERLPIPIEMVEEAGQIGGSPTIRIDGNEVKSARHHFEHLCSLLSGRWREINHEPLTS
ncbi:MAG: hypothetical protein U0103_03935 [Candidatus Obscuribacterales bacterium]|nr:hypothetical protein [Cyanobacteria bacterium SZAS LIN-5]RTL46165.1 MAG: hypothetical protein EKK48_02175 [Candidatus Melainabacteria bacterium]